VGVPFFGDMTLSLDNRSWCFFMDL